MELRRCKDCGKEKTLGDFPLMDNHHSWRKRICYECDRLRQREKRLSHIERYRASAKRYYYSNREVILKRMSEYKKNNRLKANARAMSSLALDRGRIQREKCFKCGDDNTEAHHPDYFKPLEVVWLCRRCHQRLHGNERIVHKQITIPASPAG